jgi:hypothetical protein
MAAVGMVLVVPLPKKIPKFSGKDIATHFF